MSPSTTRRWLQLSHLLLAVGYVSATTLTLTNFEDIAPKVAVKSCRTAYNTPLTNCGIDDFSNGNKCSSDCKSSIAEAQSNIQTECEGVSVDSNSLLYRAQKGQLQQVICLSSDDDDEPATTTAKVPASKSNQNQMIETSEIKRKTTSTADVATETTLTAQTTSLVLAGGGSTGLGSDATSASAAAETTKSDSRGGDPFASNSDSDNTSGSGPASRVGYASLVISAVVCMMAAI